MDNLQERQAKVCSLRKFIATADNVLDSVLRKLGWTRLSLSEKTACVQCPYDSNHKMPKEVLEVHKEVCKLKKQGYTREEIEAAECSLTYQSTPGVVQIDEEAMRSILKKSAEVQGLIRIDSAVQQRELPLNYDREMVEFTREERLAMHQYVVNKGKELKKQQIEIGDFMIDWDAIDAKKEDTDRPKSLLEQRAEQRDYKRRRQTYRAKNVHITQKSYTEVIRDVIANQTELLESVLSSAAATGGRPSIKQEQVDDDYPDASQDRTSSDRVGCGRDQRTSRGDRVKAEGRVSEEQDDSRDTERHRQRRRHRHSRERDTSEGGEMDRHPYRERRSRDIDPSDGMEMDQRPRGEKRSRERDRSEARETLQRHRKRRSRSRSRSSSKSSSKPSARRHGSNTDKNSDSSVESHRDDERKRHKKKHKKHKHHKSRR
ncbi:PREDICTED: U11/U12 small nuclear ribonucleoprotein 48 kDa protein-like isoform X2 [Priapulus caudatus]|uniref:U11/U12 small nuclear ribonucleoprotein 48 kDa protein-like isoform X2 n=1 Tax=Priapulus caudatus TaxID=37621 RepID=A0ABM1EF16_PRICU|nr:PREDICTED: U11/U12 small nuclear ribonucleoprotein 48 kDa protein-like isoform X2 [Priapulus caudatus]